MDRLLPQINIKQLLTLYRLIFLCGNYRAIKLIYENSTIPMLDPIVQSMSGYSSILINYDLVKSYNYTNTDENTLIIFVLDDDSVAKIKQFATQYQLRFYFHYLFVSRNFNETAVNDKVMDFAKTNLIDNVGIILINPNGTWKSSRFMYDKPLVVEIPNELSNGCSIYDKMFYKKSKDLSGEDYYVYIMHDPPRGIRVTSRNTDGKEVNTFGGREAYLASLIPSKINITVKLFACSFSDAYSKNTTEYMILKNFLEKTYEEDDHTPKQLNYTKFLQNDVSNFLKNHAVLGSFESEYFTQNRKLQSSLYSHEMDNFIFVVPNQVQRKSTLLLSILKMPLFSVWALAIIIFSISRKILRSVFKSVNNEFCSIFFNTFGLSFGTAGGSTNTTHISSSEQLLLWFLSVFAMLAGILCSGMLVTEFATTVLMPSINSLDDLGRNPHIGVVMPREFDNTTATWLQQQIPNPIYLVDRFFILGQIFIKDTSYAYIIPESKVDILLGRDDMIENGQNLFHVIKFNFLTQPVRFAALRAWALEPLNELVQQAIEFGFMINFERRTKRIMRIKKVKKTGKQNEISTRSIAMKELHFLFILYAFGVTVSTVLFFSELLIGKYLKKLAQKKLKRNSK